MNESVTEIKTSAAVKKLICLFEKSVPRKSVGNDSSSTTSASTSSMHHQDNTNATTSQQITPSWRKSEDSTESALMIASLNERISVKALIYNYQNMSFGKSSTTTSTTSIRNTAPSYSKGKINSPAWLSRTGRGDSITMHWKDKPVVVPSKSISSITASSSSYADIDRPQPIDKIEMMAPQLAAPSHYLTTDPGTVTPSVSSSDTHIIAPNVLSPSDAVSSTTTTTTTPKCTNSQVITHHYDVEKIRTTTLHHQPHTVVEEAQPTAVGLDTTAHPVTPAKGASKSSDSGDLMFQQDSSAYNFYGESASEEELSDDMNNELENGGVSPLPMSYQVISASKGHLEIVLPPPPTKSLLKKSDTRVNKSVNFVEDPTSIVETYNIYEYTRGDENLDPIAASAQYEIEKKTENLTKFEVVLNKDGKGLGLSIVGIGLGSDTGEERLGIYIKALSPGGVAETEGSLRVHDQLLEVDGVSLVGVSQKFAGETLKKTDKVVKFLVGREPGEENITT